MKNLIAIVSIAFLVGCAHDDPHAFIAPSNEAVVKNIDRAKKQAVAIRELVKPEDKKKVDDLIHDIADAQNQLSIYSMKVDKQATLLTKVSDEANYWHLKQTKALKELWIWRGLCLASALAVVAYLGLKTAWRFWL